MIVKYTKHAERKIKERNIDKGLIKITIENFDFQEKDKFDTELIHYIKIFSNRF